MIQHTSEQKGSSGCSKCHGHVVMEQLTNPRDMPRLRAWPPRAEGTPRQRPERGCQGPRAAPSALAVQPGRTRLRSPADSGAVSASCTKPCNSNQTSKPVFSCYLNEALGHPQVYGLGTSAGNARPHFRVSPHIMNDFTVEKVHLLGTLKRPSHMPHTVGMLPAESQLCLSSAEIWKAFILESVSTSAKGTKSLQPRGAVTRTLLGKLQKSLATCVTHCGGCCKLNYYHYHLLATKKNTSDLREKKIGPQILRHSSGATHRLLPSKARAVKQCITYGTDNLWVGTLPQAQSTDPATPSPTSGWAER